MIRFLKNESGMSLVQIMVALALTGVLSVILMNLAEQQNKQTKTAFVNSEVIEILTQLNTMIANRDSCEATFLGLPKGQDLQQFRMSWDPNLDPYAQVGEKFRGTKLILSGFRILTDAEVTARGQVPIAKDNATGKTVIKIELKLDRPNGVIGGKTISKLVDVAVVMGQGEIDTGEAKSGVIQTCLDNTSNLGCIANFDTGICNPDSGQWENDIRGATPVFVGYCINPTPPSPTDDVIIKCVTAN